MTPSPDREVRDFYDDFADYQLRYVVGVNPRFREIRKRLTPVLARSPTSALDIGCGIGVQTNWLAERIPDVTGVDISPRSIRMGAALYAVPRFVVCNLPDDELPPGCYDLITAFDVLEHFQTAETRAAVFARIRSVLDENGVLVVNVPSRLFAIESPATCQQVVDEAIRADEIVALASSIGLEPLVLDRYGIERANQYVFACFSRHYDVSQPARRRSRTDRFLQNLELRRARRRGVTLLNRLPKDLRPSD